MKNNPDDKLNHPNLIKKYNQGMGEVDVMDRLLGSCRPIISGKKWYWLLIINAINVSVTAAWHVHCAVESKPIKSRLQIGVGRITVLPDDIRYDDVDHIRVSAPQGRCKICQKNN